MGSRRLASGVRARRPTAGREAVVRPLATPLRAAALSAALLLAAGCGPAGGGAAAARALARVDPHPTAKGLARATALTAPPAGGGVATRPAKPNAAAEAWVRADPFCVLPLSRPELPPTADGLAASLLAAWRAGLTFPAPAKVIAIQGGAYPTVSSMRVVLSDAVAETPGKREKVAPPPPGANGRHLAVADFALVGEPIVAKATGSRVNVRVTATDARFDLRADTTGRPLLLLTDAASGSLSFDVAVRDVEKALLAAARVKGGLIGVRSVKVDFRTSGPRSLDLSVHVGTVVGFVPAGLRFAGRVDVDERMNATLSRLTAEGDDLFGPLLAAIVRPQLAKVDGKTKPILSFPSPALKVRDVRLGGGDRITLHATFGR